MANERKTVMVRIPAELLTELRRLPLPKQCKTDTSRVLYALRIGIAGYAYSFGKEKE